MDTKFKLMGNYFLGEFHQPVTLGPNAVETFISRHCPADLSLKLWNAPIEYRHVDAVIDSAVQVLNRGEKHRSSKEFFSLKNIKNKLWRARKRLLTRLVWKRESHCGNRAQKYNL